MRPVSKIPIPTLDGNFQEVVVGDYGAFTLGPFGRLLAYEDNQQINLWDLEQNVALGHPLIGHDSWINSLDFSPDGHLLVSGDHDGKLIVWSVPRGEQEMVLQGHQSGIWDLAVSPDGSLVASLDGSDILILWELATGQEVARLVNEDSVKVKCLEFSPNSELLAFCSSWDVSSDEYG